ncbi:Exocyst complex component EXO84A [Heracleum sosnowskyi]|uniref:Exocyst complex component EXO84A n=2 Tax=Heracleum sosnowskyi TaxID=360622 RepID=A0AAD8HGN7_9APIA|nr:Exocyst complex component EXO84A [Heracleum sosnowskyi]
MHMHISAPTSGLKGKNRTKTSTKKHHQYSSSPVTSVGSSGSNMVPSLGDATELIGSDQPTLSEKLKVFKASGFDPEGFLTTKCRNMSHKEVKNLCLYLVDLKKASAEEMRKSVYANYPSFIRTSREISDLEGQLLDLKNLLSSRAVLVNGLTDGIRIDSFTSNHEDTEYDVALDDMESSNQEKWIVEFMETLEVLLAERRIDEALHALDEGEQIAQQDNRYQSSTSTAMLQLQNNIIQQRQKLADSLVESASHPSATGAELRSSVQALKRLGDGPRAHGLLLRSHYRKLQHYLRDLHPAGPSLGAAYITAISQLTFSTLAQAATDSLAIFGDEPCYTSELVTWAVSQTESFALLVKRHFLASPASSGSLRIVSECVQVCLGHCSMLEARGMALSPVLLKICKPCVEQAFTSSLKRIEQSTAAIAASDDWSLNYPPLGSRSVSASSLLSQPKLSSSAHRFNSMTQEICEDVGSLENLSLANHAVESLLQLFDSYIKMLINALPNSTETENVEGRIVRVAETEAQQLTLLANALVLADELLPRAVSRFSHFPQTDDGSRRGSDRQNRAPEQRELKKRLQRLVDQLRDSFCRQHALDLIFNEDGTVRLSADMYFNMDANSEDLPEWFPSPIYQELFGKATLVASMASDVFVGKDRFATILLMRLTETVILWLSDDQSFWEDIEQGPQTLGPLGLQQFYLDMQFVILFASQGRYLSRHLHQVIKNIIGRAIDAVAATKVDPYSLLPEDEWFTDVAQIAIEVLTGKEPGENENEGIHSPIAPQSVECN